jgi:hypothetical protein
MAVIWVVKMEVMKVETSAELMVLKSVGLKAALMAE